MVIKMGKVVLGSMVLLLSLLCIKAQAEIMSVDGHQLHYHIWDNTQSSEPPTVVLLSGPNSSWHSDSAWWGSLAPKLAKTHKVIAIDRASLVLANSQAKVGYSRFAQDLVQVFKTLKVEDAVLVGFASGSLSILQYLHQHPTSTAISKVILLDPDVLTEFSINRYKQDALPFKSNLDKYVDYINSGKYTARVKQKNAADMTLLKTLAKDDSKVDWDYINRLFAARLEITNQLNLFKEIAQYGEDLDLAAQTSWPKHIPLIIIDSRFEQEAIDDAEDDETKAGLIAWQTDAKAYYKKWVESIDDGQYIEVDSEQHLYQFVEPQYLIKWIEKSPTANP
jgi:pimeloyl-ACP methyl ester carboxylesterase